MRQTIKWTAVFALVVFSGLCVAGTGFAGDKKKDTKANIWTKDHAIDTGRPTVAWPDGDGEIAEIYLDEKRIVLGDTQLFLSDDVKFLKGNGKKANSADFKKGERVAYKFGSDKKISILYILDKKKKNKKKK